VMESGLDGWSLVTQRHSAADSTPAHAPRTLPSRHLCAAAPGPERTGRQLWLAVPSVMGNCCAKPAPPHLPTPAGPSGAGPVVAPSADPQPSLGMQHAFLDTAKSRDWACLENELRACAALVNVTPAGRWSALHQAAHADDLAAVQMLLRWVRACVRACTGPVLVEQPPTANCNRYVARVRGAGVAKTMAAACL
jgi:hypothetical protein